MAGSAAVRRAKQNGEWRESVRREDTSRWPEDFAAALANDPEARRGFERMAPSHKK